jgi:hypothetical protein
MIFDFPARMLISLVYPTRKPHRHPEGGTTEGSPWHQPASTVYSKKGILSSLLGDSRLPDGQARLLMHSGRPPPSSSK